MSKKKLKNGLDLYITEKGKSRFVLRDGETVTLTNQTGVEVLIVTSASVRLK